MYSLTTRGAVIRDKDGATIPPDPNNMDWRAYQDWIAAGNEPTPPSDSDVQALTIDRHEEAVQNVLDSAAQARGYEGILSASTYATSKHPRFGPEGIAFRDWRDACWDYCYQALTDVQAGKRQIPEVKELLAELPPAPTFG